LLVAGVLDGDNYLGGELKLDTARAEQALLSAVGEPLGQDAAAAAITTIDAFEAASGANIASAIAAGGRKPQDTSLIAFGGGGPMIITGIAEATGIKKVIIPRLASVFSAFGIGFSHLAHAYQASLDGADAEDVAAQLRGRAERDMYGEGVSPDECRYDAGLWGAKGDAVVEAPLTDAKKFAQGVSDARVTLKAVYELPTSGAAAKSGQAGVNVDGSGKTDLATYDDASLEAGQTIAGPALLRGAYLTCLIRAGWSLRVTKNLDLVIEAD
jgi:N-methylhydantoinase A/oxoprolinase/acetone carboxylase beta subunit